MPAARQTRTKQLTLAGLISQADRAMAQEKFSTRDSTTDRLFALLMARLDIWQAHRAAALPLLDDLRRQPAAMRQLAAPLFSSMKLAIAQADLALDEPRLSLQATGLFVVYLATLRTWQKDTDADMSATMRALDQNLRRAAIAGRWLGFEAR